MFQYPSEYRNARMRKEIACRALPNQALQTVLPNETFGPTHFRKDSSSTSSVRTHRLYLALHAGTRRYKKARLRPSSVPHYENQPWKSLATPFHYEEHD